MAVETSQPASPATPAPVVEEQLYCSLTGRPLTREEAYWAPPLVTVRELFTTTFSTAFRAPAVLGQILLGEQDNVPYAPEARELLAKRRSAEQLKLLIVLLVLAAIIVIPILLLSR
ncbi:MAG: hypothetical protein Fur005_03540 [Roseiflexaceae bacterium]